MVIAYYEENFILGVNMKIFLREDLSIIVVIKMEIYYALEAWNKNIDAINDISAINQGSRLMMPFLPRNGESDSQYYIIFDKHTLPSKELKSILLDIMSFIEMAMIENQLLRHNEEMAGGRNQSMMPTIISSCDVGDEIHSRQRKCISRHAFIGNAYSMIVDLFQVEAFDMKYASPPLKYAVKWHWWKYIVINK